MCRQPLFVGDLDTVLDNSSLAYAGEGRSRDTRLALCGHRVVAQSAKMAFLVIIFFSVCSSQRAARLFILFREF